MFIPEKWEYHHDMSTSPERIQPNDVISRRYLAQMCPNFSSCANADATGKACERCGTELPGFIAGLIACDKCGEHRFYCAIETSELPGNPDLHCFTCDAVLHYEG